MPQHSETRFLPYTPQQLYALVADIENYPQFLPWCLGARITKRESNQVTADLIIGYKGMREKFTSLVTLMPPEEITVSYGGGPLKHLGNSWKFHPAKGGCDLEFYVDFAFSNRLFSSLMDGFFDHAFRKMVAAFEARAAKLYQ